MDKPLKFASLADMLADYVSAYASWWHTVLRVRIGLPVPHDAMYEGTVRTLLAVLFFTHKLRKAHLTTVDCMTSAECPLSNPQVSPYEIGSAHTINVQADLLTSAHANKSRWLLMYRAVLMQHS